MIRKKLILVFIVLLLILVPGSMLYAQYDINDAAEDLNLAAETLSKIFAASLGSISYLCEPVGYAFTPKFSVGVATGITFVPLEEIAEDLQIDLEFDETRRVTIPAIGVHAKYSVKRIEFGAKLAGVPQVDIGDDDLGVRVENIIVGAKVRYKLVEFKRRAMKGGISVGGLYEYMNGDIVALGTDTFIIDENEDGVDDAEIFLDAGLLTDWNAHTIGGEAQANFQFLILNFFAGTRLSNSWGGATTSVRGNATTKALAGGSGNVIEETKAIDIEQEVDPDDIDLFFFGGVEVKLWVLTIGTKATYNLNNNPFTIDAGIRIQF
jgi:hypothetical protein